MQQPTFLPMPIPSRASSTNDGRITCYAAKAMLARAYLFYTGVYGKEPQDVSKAEVLQGLEDIIQSGEYALVPLYKNLWYCASTKWEGSDQAGWKEVSHLCRRGQRREHPDHEVQLHLRL